MKKFKKEHLLLAAILFVIFLLRFPSLFEPFWYGDEGIFAAVGRNLNLGGVLYQSAWDNKPPMIYLTYAVIFKYLGVSMFSLRLVTLVVVLATSAVIYEIAQTVLSTKRALVATFIFGFLTSLRVIEGNLALTEIFMVLPITLAFLIAIARNFDFISLLFSGFLFAIASLYKQVGAFEAAALGIYLFFISKNWGEFIKRGISLSAGFVFPYALTLGYFWQKHLVGEYIFAAYTYYNIYFSESPKYAKLINILKYIAILAAILYGVYKKWGYQFFAFLKLQKGRGEIGLFHLFLLWTGFSFLGSYFSGRAYGHYLIQAIPALCLLLASISFKFSIKKSQAIFAVVFFGSLLLLTRILFFEPLSTGGPINQVGYLKNFVQFATGEKTVSAYNDYFNRNVNSIMGLADFFRAQRTDKPLSVYIWGDYPWLYAISDLKNPSRFVTSFHVFGVPNGKEEVFDNLSKSMPDFIVKAPNSAGYFSQLEMFLSEKYTLVGTIENSQVFRK